MLDELDLWAAFILERYYKIFCFDYYFKVFQNMACCTWIMEHTSQRCCAPVGESRGVLKMGSTHSWLTKPGHGIPLPSHMQQTLQRYTYLKHFTHPMPSFSPQQQVVAMVLPIHSPLRSLTELCNLVYDTLNSNEVPTAENVKAFWTSIINGTGAFWEGTTGAIHGAVILNE